MKLKDKFCNFCDTLLIWTLNGVTFVIVAIVVLILIFTICRSICVIGDWGREKPVSKCSKCSAPLVCPKCTTTPTTPPTTTPTPLYPSPKIEVR